MEFVTFNTGVMGAGKSKKLIDQFNADQTCKIAFTARFKEDTGKFVKIKSRNGAEISALSLNVDQEDDIFHILTVAALSGYEAIYVDEVQFLSEEIIKVLIEIANEFEVNIHLFGLSTDFLGKHFDSSKHLLMNLPEKDIYFVGRICSEKNCIEQALYSARIVNGNIARNGETFVEEKSTYKALCPKHYN